MICGAMATTKSKAKRAPTPATPRVKTARADGRAKSALTIAGEQAKLEAERTLLREALVIHAWNATHAGRSLGINHVQTVLRQIERLGLRAEYDQNNTLA